MFSEIDNPFNRGIHEHVHIEAQGTFQVYTKVGVPKGSASRFNVQAGQHIIISTGSGENIAFASIKDQANKADRRTSHTAWVNFLVAKNLAGAVAELLIARNSINLKSREGHTATVNVGGTQITFTWET